MPKKSNLTLLTINLANRYPLLKNRGQLDFIGRMMGDLQGLGSEAFRWTRKMSHLFEIDNIFFSQNVIKKEYIQAYKKLLNLNLNAQEKSFESTNINIDDQTKIYK